MTGIQTTSDERNSGAITLEVPNEVPTLPLTAAAILLDIVVTAADQMRFRTDDGPAGALPESRCTTGRPPRSTTPDLHAGADEPGGQR
ncbi:hypothetical protein ACH4YO_34310 [Streptomyces noursei]|uniref:hypothetical protein n=1 Tax=Streptomyces noursei TaxID=1971 RepID=UPI0033FED769